MDDKETAAQDTSPKPAPGPAEDIGETKKVDTQVQEEAAKQREETGGYE